MTLAQFGDAVAIGFVVVIGSVAVGLAWAIGDSICDAWKQSREFKRRLNLNRPKDITRN